MQLTGVLSMLDEDRSSVDAVRDVARASGGPAYVFYAPFTVPDASTARALRRQPEVARALGYIPSVTRAVGGLGQWAPGQSTLHDAAAARDRGLRPGMKPRRRPRPDDAQQQRSGAGRDGRDPTLLGVMCGAIPVYLVAWFWQRGRPSLWGSVIPAKANHSLDGRLILGATLFGVGWGLAGVCPGPAVTNVAAPSAFTLTVLASILAGVALSFLVPARAK